MCDRVVRLAWLASPQLAGPTYSQSLLDYSRGKRVSVGLLLFFTQIRCERERQLTICASDENCVSIRPVRTIKTGTRQLNHGFCQGFKSGSIWNNVIQSNASVPRGHCHGLRSVTIRGKPNRCDSVRGTLVGLQLDVVLWIVRATHSYLRTSSKTPRTWRAKANISSTTKRCRSGLGSTHLSEPKPTTWGASGWGPEHAPLCTKASLQRRAAKPSRIHTKPATERPLLRSKSTLGLAKRWLRLAEPPIGLLLHALPKRRRGLLLSESSRRATERARVTETAPRCRAWGRRAKAE